jgi:solute:Na+ symporter, SSS family
MGIAVIFVWLGIRETIVNEVLAVAGFSSGILVGVFALGVATRHVNQQSALMGMLAGAGVLTWVKFWTPVAWPWYALIGAAVTILTGLGCSLFQAKSAPTSA